MLLFTRMPGGNVVYAVGGARDLRRLHDLDFNRMRRAGRGEVVSLAAGIFLDVINIFLFFLQIFGRN